MFLLLSHTQSPTSYDLSFRLRSACFFHPFLTILQASLGVNEQSFHVLGRYLELVQNPLVS